MTPEILKWIILLSSIIFLILVNIVANKITNAEFDFYNTLRNDNRDLEKYDLFGFATFTDFLGVPYFFKKFIDSLHSMYKKPVFVRRSFHMELLSLIPYQYLI